jgi:hypothetical protein
VGFLFEILAELLVQIIFEVLAELGIHGVKDTFRNPRRPFLSTIGFLVWGLLAGGISLWLFPHSFIADKSLRLANLAITPILAGSLMLAIGRLRARRGQELVGLDRFGYAFAFALAMALVRFFFAK